MYEAPRLRCARGVKVSGRLEGLSGFGRRPLTRAKPDRAIVETHRQSGERIVRVDEQQGKPAVTQFQLLSISDEFR